MSFLNPLFLLGMAALAAPILVHLVRRSRAKRVEFPSLMFVRRIPQRTMRRKQLHNLLLLAMRCLALLLLILAFTRPYFSGANSAEANSGDRASVILLDRSFSMRYGNRFEQAKARALATIDIASGNDQFALICFDQGYDVIQRFTAEPGRLRTQIESVQTGWSGTDYEQALRGAEELLKEASGRARSIYLISDFQATGWDAEQAAYRLRSDIKLVPVDVAENTASNVAVTDVNAHAVIYQQKYEDKVGVRVANFGDEAQENVRIEFRINDQPIEKREIKLSARDSQIVEFTNFNLSSGVNRSVVTVSMGSANEFTFDNNFYFTLRREAQAKALIVENAGRGRSDSLFLRNALTTGENLPFTLTVKTAGSTNPAELAEHSIVILNDVRNLSSAFAENLARFVEAGGGLIIAAGRNTDVEEFNRTLARVAPVTLGEAIIARGEPIAISEIKTDHPVFEVFRNSGRLGMWRVLGYHRSEPKGNSSVLARYEDGSPALVEAPFGAGKVLLLTSTLDTSWSDLPLTPLYLPLVRQMVRYLGEQEANAWHTLGQTFTVPKAAAGGAPPAVDTPSEQRLTERVQTATGDLLITAREPGFYRLRYPEQVEFAAVDLDGKESDLAKLNLDEFLAAVTNVGDEPASTTAAAAQPSDDEIEARQRIWWPMLIGALLLFVAEAIIARRTKMAKVIG
ncbi:MAG: BatA domain-containing protein [Pyrinomonadaceae bacterium]|nr:BatA domain-containing protein [Pyrinomonadaceae bacterium]